MNTELLKSKLLEAAFNGSLTHADTSKWEQVKLGEICDYGKCINVDVKDLPKDSWILELEDIEKDTAKILQRLTLAERNIKGSRHQFCKGQLLYSKLRTYLNKVLIAPDDGYCTGEIVPLTFKDSVLTEYMCYYMRSPMVLQYTALSGYGIKMPRVNPKQMNALDVPLPPLEDQQQIVATLEEGFAAIDAIAEAKENLSTTAEMLRSKILQAAFDGSLTGVDAGIWDQKKLRDISTKIVDGDHNPPKGQKEPTPYIMLSSQNINEDKFVAMNKVRYLSKADFDLCNKRTKLTKGDVLLTTVGTVGRSCVNTDDEVYCFQRSVTIITPAINSFFLKYYFDSPDFQQLLLLSASGNAQKGFYLNKLKEVEIPVPPLAEQQRIVAKIEELFAEINRITK